MMVLIVKLKSMNGWDDTQNDLPSPERGQLSLNMLSLSKDLMIMGVKKTGCSNRGKDFLSIGMVVVLKLREILWDHLHLVYTSTNPLPRMLFDTVSFQELIWAVLISPVFRLSTWSLGGCVIFLAAMLFHISDCVSTFPKHVLVSVFKVDLAHLMSGLHVGITIKVMWSDYPRDMWGSAHVCHHYIHVHIW